MHLLKRRFRPFNSAWTFCLSAILLGSCNIDQIPDLDNTYLPKYQGEIALLAIKDTLRVGDFLKELVSDTSAYEETEDHRIIFSYTTSSDFSSVEDLIDINDFSNQKYISSPINNFYIAPKDTVLYISQLVDFNFPATKGEQIDSIIYQDGDFSLFFNSGFPSRVEYEFRSNSFTRRADNSPLTIENFVQTSNPPAVKSNTVNLEGYSTVLERSTNGDSNKFQVMLDAAVFLPEGTILSGSEYLFFRIDVENPLFETIYGNFGRDTINVPSQAVNLSFFDDLGGTGIEFGNPTITFSIDNTFGIPIGLDFSNVRATYTDQPDLSFSGSFPETVQSLAAATEVGNGANTDLVVTSSNSNIREILASSPTSLVLDLDGYTNYPASPNNFVSYNSAMTFEGHISMPMVVKVAGFEYESEIELEGLEDIEGTEEIALVFNTENMLPFDGAIDLIFIGENESRLDSMMNVTLFSTPTQFDANGRVSAPHIGSEEIILDAGKIEALTSATKLLLVTRLNSFGYQSDEFVEIYADYTLITKLSVRGKLSIDLN